MPRPVDVKYISTTHTVYVDHFPSECGRCHKNVDPTFLDGAFVKGDSKSSFLEAAFQCTNQACNSLIIGYYIRINDKMCLQDHAPISPVNKDFNKEIEEVSPNFIEIYNQAYFAEQSDLKLISGIGYRKALEFLVKDYLIHLNPDDENNILRKPLGQCIQSIDNNNIKEISKRATWIGNDEAHYIRKWEDKDVNDLKRLIEVTVYFISMDISSRTYLEEMP
ncbi:hypothetical protein ACFOZ1_06850 [Gracilibacillus marinus]|uniref:DUF4145 domain-containing protein n=1 Tax=Gracilibacillus marinus TaxID=630535 RepID=A0ABV8VSW8_9BACI